MGFEDMCSGCKVVLGSWIWFQRGTRSLVNHTYKQTKASIEDCGGLERNEEHTIMKL